MTTVLLRQIHLPYSFVPEGLLKVLECWGVELDFFPSFQHLIALFVLTAQIVSFDLVHIRSKQQFANHVRRCQLNQDMTQALHEMRVFQKQDYHRCLMKFIFLKFFGCPRRFRYSSFPNCELRNIFYFVWKSRGQLID